MSASIWIQGVLRVGVAIEAQQPMDRAGLMADNFLQALGSLAGGRRQHHFQLQPVRDAGDGGDCVRLPAAGTAGVIDAMDGGPGVGDHVTQLPIVDLDASQRLWFRLADRRRGVALGAASPSTAASRAARFPQPSTASEAW